MSVIDEALGRKAMYYRSLNPGQNGNGHHDSMNGTHDQNGREHDEIEDDEIEPQQKKPAKKKPTALGDLAKSLSKYLDFLQGVEIMEIGDAVDDTQQFHHQYINLNHCHNMLSKLIEGERDSQTLSLSDILQMMEVALEGIRKTQTYAMAERSSAFVKETNSMIDEVRLPRKAAYLLSKPCFAEEELIRAAGRGRELSL